MWNSHNNNDILDFALLWQPLGGPAPENVASAFAIDFWDYNDRLRSAARSELARPRCAATSREPIYGPSALATFG